jgi:hypothetical protein
MNEGELLVQANDLQKQFNDFKKSSDDTNKKLEKENVDLKMQIKKLKEDLDTRKAKAYDELKVHVPLFMAKAELLSSMLVCAARVLNFHDDDCDCEGTSVQINVTNHWREAQQMYRDSCKNLKECLDLESRLYKY